MNESRWIKCSIRHPQPTDYPLICRAPGCLTVVYEVPPPTVGLTTLNTEWASIKMPLPPKTKSELELDNEAFNDPLKSADFKIRLTWQAALIHARKE